MKYRINILLMLAAAVSCLPLQKNEDFDSTGNWFSKFTLDEYLERPDNQFRIFAAAAKSSGWFDEIKGCSYRTFIVPTDEAFGSFLSDHGIDDVGDIPEDVLHTFLSYFVLPVKIVSSDFKDAETVPFITALSKPMYLTRRGSSSNPYLLLVNRVFPDGAEMLGGPSASVVMQDLCFKNDIAVQVVDAVPYYAPVVPETEVFTGRLESDKIMRIETNIDTYIYNHAGFNVPQSSKAICCNSERIPVVWYENKDLSFNDEISKATAYFYRSSSNASGVVDTDFSLHDISDQVWTLTNNGSNEQALLNAVVATFLPNLNLDNYICSFPVPGTANTWFSVDVTSHIRKYYAKQERIPLGLSIKPVVAFNTSKGLLPLGYKVNSTGNTANNPSYIEVMGPIPSKTVLVNNSSMSCRPRSAIVLDNTHLLRQAAADAGSLNLSEKNILYSLVSEPEHGCLTINNIPLNPGYAFSQAQIAAGIIKYHNTETAAADKLVLKGSDYTGSTVAENIVFNITIE